MELDSRVNQTGQQSSMLVETVPEMTVKEAFRALCVNHTYRKLLVVVVINYLFSSGIIQWQPALFMRSYGLSAGVVGTWLL